MGEENNNLKGNISKWLKEQGYPLEMLVAQAFQNADFDVIQSDYYTDVESGANREIDIIANDSATYDGYITIDVSFVIECKSSPSKPWILFRYSNYISSGAEFEHLAWSEPTINSKYGDEFMKVLGENTYNELLLSLGIFQLKPIGYSLSQAFIEQKGSSKPDVPYIALNSAIKASIALAIKTDTVKRDDKYFCHIIFPIIVIDSPLFECFLEEHGEISLNQIDSGILLWNNNIGDYSHFAIPIFTKHALDKLVTMMREVADALLRRGELFVIEVIDKGK